MITGGPDTLACSGLPEFLANGPILSTATISGKRRVLTLGNDFSDNIVYVQLLIRMSSEPHGHNVECNDSPKSTAPPNLQLHSQGTAKHRVTTDRISEPSKATTRARACINSLPRLRQCILHPVDVLGRPCIIQWVHIGVRVRRNSPSIAASNSHPRTAELTRSTRLADTSPTDRGLRHSTTRRHRRSEGVGLIGLLLQD